MENDLGQTWNAWLLDPFLSKLAWVSGGLLLIVIATRLLRRTLSNHVADSSARYQARKAVTFFGSLGALVFLAAAFSDRLGGLTVAFGVAGAGIAFALQEVIASAAGWVAVSFGGFYRVGDRVQLGGIKGDVIDIGMLRTTIMEIGEWVHADQYNGRIVRVANSFVFKEPVFNYSGEFPFLWDEIVLPVKYGSDYHCARELIARVADEVAGEFARSAEQAWEPVTRRYMIEKASVQPAVTMVANSNWIEFTLRYAVDYKSRRTTRDRLFTRMLEEIDLVADRVGIAASTLNIEKMPPLEVKLRGDAALRP